MSDEVKDQILSVEDCKKILKEIAPFMGVPIEYILPESLQEISAMALFLSINSDKTAEEAIDIILEEKVEELLKDENVDIETKEELESLKNFLKKK